MSSKRQSIEQKRAAQAWKDVGEIDNKHRATLGRKYNSLARSTPALVQSNGLGQALAFLRAKAGPESNNKGKDFNEHRLLYQHLSKWVMCEIHQGLKEKKEKEQKFDEKDAKLKKELLEWIVQQDTQIYRRATAETMAYLVWLKRFAEAVLPEAAANEE